MIKSYVDAHPALKRFIHWLLVPKNEARPRQWVSWFLNPFVHQRHITARIRARVRMDVLPFNPFVMGANSLIEDFSVVNNGVGSVVIGKNCLLGIGSTLIGPVRIGDNVIIAQHVVLSGMNHEYKAIATPIRNQSVTTAEIIIEDDCWIGANVTITAGVTIGRHSVVAGGSVVVYDVPAYTVVGGNPARVLKQYEPDSGQWLSAASASAVLAGIGHQVV